MRTKLLIFSIAAVLFISSCELYPKYEDEYSAAYPLAGNYYVKNYNPGALNFSDAQTSYYEMFIYNASFEAEKYIWINTTNNFSETNFRIKNEYDLDNLSFNCNMLPHISSGAEVPDSVIKYVTIAESKLIQNEWPTPDSLVFKVTVYDGNQNLVSEFYTLGHRSTGQEVPNFDI